VFNDGSIYEGEVRGDRLEGKGKMIWGKDSEQAGDIYEGEFKNDIKEGKGYTTIPFKRWCVWRWL
jgi:hypothetical protein